MQTLQEAIKKANKYAEATDDFYAVVLSRDEYDIPGNDYHIANDHDLDTFFYGCPILYSTT